MKKQQTRPTVCKKAATETDREKIKMMEFTEKNLETAVINMTKDLNKNMNIMRKDREYKNHK